MTMTYANVHSTDGTCNTECSQRAVARGYMAPANDAINIYAQLGRITNQLVTEIDAELRLAVIESGRTTQMTRRRELEAMRSELAAMRRHVIRVNPTNALGEQS